jgi:hypothetical protein
MKPDEEALLLAIYEQFIAYIASNRTVEMPRVRQIVLDSRVNHKRAYYLLDKWVNKGWYEYGVSIAAGWLTKEGYFKAAEIKTKRIRDAQE